ncbi:UDP-N-acetylhexosamine pyrophosphorylase-like isoform X2 [Xenia sp. Carnegie-2017]|uniref:UDP-N-acetylhexosamine pyrophosphorylase-like isoform X2 n=1 Tax=Xenia sp. Carnegie-2017 TaxID=2897299 RepID=UPI001F03C1DE|nr:UDP-N-acetylhexosamine pyrophosphorylase-like isoform X2 [Xenia sp. Carnegie-2017]
MDLAALRTKLESYGQEHLLQHYDRLKQEEKSAFLDELSHLDFDRVKRIYELSCEEANNSGEKQKTLEPIPESSSDSVASASDELKNEWRYAGLKAIAESKVAVLLLAGGQGTRLNVPYPKGMYDVGLPSSKTLYQIQAERILKVQKLAEEHTGKSCIVTWYIMTSEHTQTSTEAFFLKHNHFGLKKENIVFFEQYQLPCLSPEGKIILQEAGKIAKAPDGNGGLYKALRDRGILDGMSKRGIENIHVYGVDNILVKVADPIFIGFCLSKSANCGAKVVEKVHPTEKVGVICRLDGRYKVVEYSELSLELAQKRHEKGHLLYNAGNICNHYFTLNFLKDVVSNHEHELRPHVAKKKIPYIDDDGNSIKPLKENGIKLEKFVFDVFEFSQQFAVLQVVREEEFSPLKNAPGAVKDTPEMARDALCNLHYQYIVNAGGKFKSNDGKILPDISRKTVVDDSVDGSGRVLRA